MGFIICFLRTFIRRSREHVQDERADVSYFTNCVRLEMDRNHGRSGRSRKVERNGGRGRNHELNERNNIASEWRCDRRIYLLSARHCR